MAKPPAEPPGPEAPFPVLVLAREDEDAEGPGMGTGGIDQILCGESPGRQWPPRTSEGSGFFLGLVGQHEYSSGGNIAERALHSDRLPVDRRWAMRTWLLRILIFGLVILMGLLVGLQSAGGA